MTGLQCKAQKLDLNQAGLAIANMAVLAVCLILISPYACFWSRRRMFSFCSARSEAKTRAAREALRSLPKICTKVASGDSTNSFATKRATCMSFADSRCCGGEEGGQCQFAC